VRSDILGDRRGESIQLTRLRLFLEKMTCFLNLLPTISSTSSRRGAFWAPCDPEFSECWLSLAENDLRPLISLGEGGPSSARWRRWKSTRPFYPLVLGGLRAPRGLDLSYELVLDADDRLSPGLPSIAHEPPPSIVRPAASED